LWFLMTHGSASLSGVGTGPGVVIRNRIVTSRQSGEIEFQFEPGDRRFNVRLPIKRALQSR
jgi:nitrogen-specific signal transduction histidine kinase